MGDSHIPFRNPEKDLARPSYACSFGERSKFHFFASLIQTFVKTYSFHRYSFRKGFGKVHGVPYFDDHESCDAFCFYEFFPQCLCVQDANFWQTLAQVHFENKKDKGGYTVEVPVFSNYLKTFQGKHITLKGYVIPLEEVGGSGKFMLSSLPFNLCYFCGAAGPETAVEVETTEKVKFSSKNIVMEGTLMLNDRDPNHHIYILKAARLVP